MCIGTTGNGIRQIGTLKTEKMKTHRYEDMVIEVLDEPGFEPYLLFAGKVKVAQVVFVAVEPEEAVFVQRSLCG